jgi:DNA topoisomerase-1
MVFKKGKFGPFLACSSYPQCKTTMKLVKEEDGSFRVAEEEILEEKCPICGKNLSIKRGPYGDFVSCLNYPECTYIKSKETGVSCPRTECNGIIVEKRSKKGKLFYGCNKYPECDFILWDKPVPQTCPKCGSPYLLERIRKGGK